MRALRPRAPRRATRTGMEALMRTSSRVLIALTLFACNATPATPECTEDETLTTECSSCGPTDACVDPVEVCAPACEGEFTPCDDEGGVCFDGLCLHNVCG